MEKSLHPLYQEVLCAFRRSRLNTYPGPGGQPAMVGQEEWNVGFSQGSRWFATNGIASQRIEVDRHYYYDEEDGAVYKHETAERIANNIWGIGSKEAVTDDDELRWLIGLINAVGAAGPEGCARVEPFDGWF